MLTRFLSLAFLFFAALYPVQSQSTFIHVDQFGYLPSADKVAVLSDPITGYNSDDNYTPPAIIELRDANTNAIVYSAAPSVWNSGATQVESGDRGWWFDFSTVTSPGSYYVYDATNDESSAVFEINAEIYNDILKAAGRMYFYNRCGAVKTAANAGPNWADDISFTQDQNTRFIEDPTNAALEKDMSGGWFDAGDFNKYVTFAHGAVHNLLWAYQDNPENFDDDWNIPESSNGIPDIIDEIKWELDFLLKMANPDGSVHIKMGSQNFTDNSATPPSANTDTRFYGPTCTAASISAASMFSHAAKVFEEFPSLNAYAQILENNAIATWDYVLPHLNNNTLETACDDGSIVAGDADWTVEEQRHNALTAAIHLFDLTNAANYNEYILDNITDSRPMGPDLLWDNYNLTAVDALLLYTTLSDADPTLVDDLLTTINTQVTNNYNDYFGWNTLDLYRAHMPTWSYHWGSNSPKAAFGALNNLLIKHGIQASSADSFKKRAAGQLHYFHGVNPQGLVYLSNMASYGAERSLNEVYHGWFLNGSDWDNVETSLYGPAPGFVPGGPNQYYEADMSLTPPYGQPLQKSYLDWNTGFPENSWEITEPGIYYQANYLRLLSAFSEPIALPVEWLTNPQAYLADQDVIVKWFTSSEWYNEKFVVEHSLDGIRFEALGSLSGAGNSETNQSYKYRHQKAPVGTNYYRIKQVDYDGAFQYSTVVSVTVDPHSKINLYPNPANEYFIITGPSSNYRVQLSDVYGATLQSFQFSGEHKSVDIGRLPKGIYAVRIWDEQNGFSLVRQMVRR